MPATPDVDVVDRSVTSRDGTAIRYRQVGSGPGVVVLHGSMSSGFSHLDLARGLADTFTVHLPDRRGHGPGGPDAGGPYRDGAVVPQEVEDLQALLAATGARDVVAVSSGALITLQAALTDPGAIRRAVLFEPPLLADVDRARALRDTSRRELDAGDVRGALVTGWRAVELGPALLRALPRPLLKAMVGAGLAAERRRGSGGYTPMGTLAATLPHNFSVVAELAGSATRFADVGADVLLLGGSRSPAYLKAALDGLEAVLPRVTRRELPDVGHEAAGNGDQRGRPLLVAAEVRRHLEA